ncbi:hypothetical protein DES53_102775 [Roseimicrobium gellanilyticum]|uniref:Uncharacterized protein n=1 Tax=Roseimicrobium gellanilyticum TaxID=748857 RepID=A0A366HTZ1_9BACT|nr:hypothetical protein DES53_102775 [Roseimicrobium gellanilyticum]
MAKPDWRTDWNQRINGRIVRHVTKADLKMSGSRNLARWWILSLDNGDVLFARPHQLVSARTKDGSWFCETDDCRSKRMRRPPSKRNRISDEVDSN